jgi:hypothetical protein
MVDNGSTPWLTPGQENDPGGWIELGLDALRSDRDDPPMPIPFRLFARRFKSSSPDAEWFLHDPLGVLLRERPPGFPSITDEWHVTTFIVNHHRTLSWVHKFVLAIVSEDEKTVALTIYKQPGS